MPLGKARRYAFVVMAIILLIIVSVLRSTTITPPVAIPSEEPHAIPIRFGLYFGPILSNKTGQINPADINIGLWVRFRGTLTPNKEVTLDGAGYLGTQLANYTVDFVDIFFKLSLAYPIGNDSNGLPQETRLTLYRVWVFAAPLFEVRSAYITWPDPGDYSPTIDVVFWNHTVKESNFPLNAVHVETISQNQTEAINQIYFSVERTNTILTIVLVGLAAMDMIIAVLPYLEEYEKSGKKSDSDPYQPE